MAYRPSNSGNMFSNYNNPMQGVLTPTVGVPNPSTGVEGSYGTGTYPQTPIPAGFVPGGDRPRPDWQNNIVGNPHMQNNFWQNLLSAFGNASPRMGQPMQPNEEVFRVGTGPAFGGGAASPGWGPNAWGMQQVQQQLGGQQGAGTHPFAPPPWGNQGGGFGQAYGMAQQPGRKAQQKPKNMMSTGGK